MAGFSLDTEPTGVKEEPTKVSSPTSEFNLEEIKKYWLEGSDIKPKLITLLYGADGTAKSFLAAENLTDEDIKAGMRMVVIDLDGGFANLLPVYYKERCESLGRKVEDVFLVKNPITLNNEGDIDYKETFTEIKKAIYLVKSLHKEMNIKVIVLDGLTTLLLYAENLMRIEKSLTVDGGVSIAFWKRRNKYFLDIIEQIKSLTTSSILIGHENFILKELEDNSSVIIKTSALCHQKIKMVRVVDKLKNTVTFKATVDKSKNNIRAEGSVYNVLSLDKTTGEYVKSTKDLFKDLV